MLSENRAVTRLHRARPGSGLSSERAQQQKKAARLQHQTAFSFIKNQDDCVQAICRSQSFLPQTCSAAPNVSPSGGITFSRPYSDGHTEKRALP